jgi:type IV pilus assembly protein PilA
MKKYMEERNENGFTLIELLIAIVVVGILAAVAIVGISGLTNTGGKSACVATADAAKAASAAYYANQSPNLWPADFTAMTPAVNPVLDLQNGAKVGADTTTIVGSGWTLHGTFDATGATAPTFDTSVAATCTAP